MLAHLIHPAWVLQSESIMVLQNIKQVSETKKVLDTLIRCLEFLGMQHPRDKGSQDARSLEHP